MSMPKELKQVQRLNVERVRLIRRAEGLQAQVQRLIDAANALGAKAAADLATYVRTLPPEAQALAESVPELQTILERGSLNGR